MKNLRPRLLALLLLVCVLLSQAALAELSHSFQIASIDKHGNLLLNATGTQFLELGFACGDIVDVEINGSVITMPVCTTYTDVDFGTPLCRVTINEAEGKNALILAVNSDSFAQLNGIATREEIAEDPGYRWNYAPGVSSPLVTITLQKSGAYLEEWLNRQVVRSSVREDYPHLSDAQFANFRMITSSGMGKGVLYRSSSPVNPELSRNAYADAAAAAAGISSIVNLADTAQGMQDYGTWNGSYYSLCKTISLNIDTNFQSAAFNDGLSKALRFIIENEGPYLIHCNEGKDRAGFVAAVLESLMGATAEEIIADYMLSFYYYYGIQPGSPQYEAIADSNLRKTLPAAFGIESLDAPGIDLSAEAEDYLRTAIGLSDAEIITLKQKLGSDLSSS